MNSPAIDVMDETFVVAPAAELAARFADPVLWRRCWPALRLEVAEDRGDEGIRWTVHGQAPGEVRGSAEIWLEPWRDGVIVHWFLRADPARAPGRARRVQQLHRRLVVTYKAGIHALKDDVESGRPAGMPPGVP